MEQNKWNSMTIGVLIGGLIVGFLIGWFWHKSAVSNDMKVNRAGQYATSTGQLPGTSSANGGAAMGSSQAAAVVGSTAGGTHYGTPDKTVAGGGSVSVSNQKAGSSVTVSNLTLEENGWVAVRDDQNGLMGNILGAHYVAKGTYSNEKITVLRATAAGKTYHVVVYREDGKNGFSKAGDMVVMKDGKAVSATFKAE